MKKDKITKHINGELKKLNKKKLEFNEKQDEIYNLLIKIYGKNGKNIKRNINYNCDDFVKRKSYIQTCLDTENSILGALGLGVISWFSTETIYEAITQIYNGEYKCFGIMKPFVAAIICLIISQVASWYLGRWDRLYRKYNLIDFELNIIDSILEKESNYTVNVENIVESHFSTIRESEQNSNET